MKKETTLIYPQINTDFFSSQLIKHLCAASNPYTVNIYAFKAGLQSYTWYFKGSCLFITSHKHWWTVWSVDCEDLKSVKLSSGTSRKKPVVLEVPLFFCNGLAGEYRRPGVGWESLRLLKDHIMAFHPLRPPKDFYGGFLLAQCAKVNVVQGGLRVDWQCIIWHDT